MMVTKGWGMALALAVSTAACGGGGDALGLKHKVSDKELAGLDTEAVLRLEAQKAEVAKAEDTYRSADFALKGIDANLESSEKQTEQAENAIEAAKDKIEATSGSEEKDLEQARARYQQRQAELKQRYEEETRGIRGRYAEQQEKNRAVLATARGSKALADAQAAVHKAEAAEQKAGKTVSMHELRVAKARYEVSRLEEAFKLSGVIGKKEEERKKGDMEIDAELKIRQEQNPDLLKQWAGAGRTPEELKEVLRFELAQFKLQTFGITITNQEIEKHYRENPTEFTIPKQAKLRVIAVQTDGEKQTVEAALKGGRKFEEVAKQYSVDVTKADGGNYGTVPIGFLATPVRDAINATKIGQVTEWITSNGQEGGPTHIKFFVEDILPERKVELDEKLRREIRRKLLLNAGQVKNDVQKEMREMRTKAKIDIKQKEFAEAYQRFIEAYLKQGG